MLSLAQDQAADPLKVRPVSSTDPNLPESILPM
jgi:hypothetical protein